MQGVVEVFKRQKIDQVVMDRMTIELTKQMQELKLQVSKYENDFMTIQKKKAELQLDLASCDKLAKIQYDKLEMLKSKHRMVHELKQHHENCLALLLSETEALEHNAAMLMEESCSILQQYSQLYLILIRNIKERDSVQQKLADIKVNRVRPLQLRIKEAQAELDNFKCVFDAASKTIQKKESTIRELEPRRLILLEQVKHVVEALDKCEQNVKALQIHLSESRRVLMTEFKVNVSDSNTVKEQTLQVLENFESELVLKLKRVSEWETNWGIIVDSHNAQATERLLNDAYQKKITTIDAEVKSDREVASLSIEKQDLVKRNTELRMTIDKLQSEIHQYTSKF